MEAGKNWRTQMKLNDEKTRERFEVSIESTILFILGGIVGLLAVGIVFAVIIFNLLTK